MSDIQTSMNRILLPDISTEPVADRPAVDSGFDLGQADVPPVLPLAFPAPLAANLAANLAAKPAKADPLAQWLEQTLGISAQFTPPAAVQADDPVPTSPPVDAETAQSDALIRPMPLISAPRVQASPIHGAAIRDDDAPNRAQPPIAPTVDPQATTRIASSALGHGDLMAVDAQPPLDAVTAVPAHQQSSTAATPPASNAAQDVAIIAQPVQPDMGASAQARPADFVSLTAIPAVPTRIKVATTVDDAAKPPVVPTPADGLTAHRATDASKQTWPVATDADAAPMPARQPDAPAEPDQPLNISASAPQPPRPDAQNLQMTSIPDAVPDTALRADLPLGARDIAMTTSPTAHAAPAQTDPRPVMQQVTSALVTTRADATEIALSPEELGRIRLVMSGPDRSHITIWAERPETLDLVRRNADLLTQHLQEAGIDTMDMDFRQDTGSTWEDGLPGGRTGLGDQDTTGPVTTTLVQLAPTPVSDRRIDIRL